MNIKQEKGISFEGKRKFAILVCDAELTITSCNTTSQILFRCSEDELIGKSICETPFTFLNKDGTTIAEENNPAKVVVRSKKPRAEIDIGIRFGASDTIWCSLGVNPEFDEEDNIVQCTLSFLEQSDFKEKRNENRALRRKEDKAIRQAKDEWKKPLMLSRTSLPY